MRAVRVTAPHQIELAEVPEPAADAWVLVRNLQVGICGTDTKIVAGKIPVDFPRIVGHELVGEVVSGPEGSPFAAGDRVLVDPGVACGWCAMCLAGRPNICINGGLLGRDVDGVFTEYTTVPVNRLVRVPDSIGDRASGLLQVLGTCVHAAKQVDVFPGQVAAVIGLGVSGQLLSQLMRLKGMRVVGITRSEWKRDLAAELGADATATPDKAADVLAEVTDGLGPDLVVEAVGIESTLGEAISLVATGGEVLVFGTLTGAGQGLPYYQLYHKELTLRNPRAALIGDYADGIDLTAAGSLTLEPLVTHVLALDEAERAFELVDDPSSLKVLMTI
ncbi:MAG TPA: alcohol dehydrogenase catalytic domain-containing protein [Acidimicrobiia bacterium]|nr:alcohol dehydrogenase catalytic domain-containing protein [Acidimicrobiia bacterium]